MFDVCVGDLVNCGGGEVDCVDIMTDEENCGGCGIRCGDFSWCEEGKCRIRTREVTIDD